MSAQMDASLTMEHTTASNWLAHAAHTIVLSVNNKTDQDLPLPAMPIQLHRRNRTYHAEGIFSRLPPTPDTRVTNIGRLALPGACLPA
ncbi:uncharacterized protein SPSK_00953 [Sporothrix schenckii 1099-18]|uniref:Uncharacterized protein n=1 Tax=Sporothrix schenckii 1099-18 TaxID=1397361 RepID=A0A0F2LYX4_SPOSC|nr:uncharacterized protein SPSK_00953 [Sporothrix schenckii 1099-18]KJR81705.1 hypothetical protein SPSK_00953 [Sporothrix schenckii 1099-18]